MSLIEETELFQFTYEELKHVHALRKRFSKGERHTLGEQWEKNVLSLLGKIVEAGNRPRQWKLEAIDQASGHLELVKILTRLAHDFREISDVEYLKRSEASQRIGRILGGWKKSL